MEFFHVINNICSSIGQTTVLLSSSSLCYTCITREILVEDILDFMPSLSVLRGKSICSWDGLTLSLLDFLGSLGRTSSRGTF
jgi:hypothetical protein